VKNKKPEASSLILQIVYGVLCLADILLCLVFHSNYDSAIGSTAAQFCLWFTGVLFVFPFLPVGCILNVQILHKRRMANVPRKGWMVYAFLSPILYVVCFIAATCVFIATTGGV